MRFKSLIAILGVPLDLFATSNDAFSSIETLSFFEIYEDAFELAF